MTERVSRILFPCALTVAAALLIKGYNEVGDGFSAGAVAGLGAVVQYVCLDRDSAAALVRSRWVRWFISAGLLAVLLLLIGPVFFGVAPITHLPRPGDEVVTFGALELHTALVFDLGVALLVYGCVVGTFERLFPMLWRDAP